MGQKSLRNICKTYEKKLLNKDSPKHLQKIDLPERFTTQIITNTIPKSIKPDSQENLTKKVPPNQTVIFTLENVAF